MSLSSKCFAVIAALLSCSAASAYNFKGYYAPAVLVSPMRDDLVYTPVGMGVVTSKAGFRVHPVTGRGDFHSGVDLGAKLNDRVYCLMDGIVTRVGWRGNLGVAVEVYHPFYKLRTIVGHLNAYAVMPGMIVQRGRVIGYAGSTGRSTGVHVHYTVMNDQDEYVEPMQFIRSVPSYVATMRMMQHQVAASLDPKNLPKFDRKLIDSDSEDLPPSKADKDKGPPPASIEP